MADTGHMAIPLQITASQQDIVEKLHNFAAFSEQTILLTGPPGAGKSSVLEVFLEQASDYANLAYLPAPERAQPEAIRKRLLLQLVKLDAYASDDTLTEALVRNLPSGTQHIIIVIDDAENLPAAMLNEFQALITHGQQSAPQQRFSIILAGGLEWAGRAIKGFSLGNQASPAVLKVEPFDSNEKAWYARALLNTQSEHVTDHKLREVLQGLTGYPGEIQLTMQRLVQPIEEEHLAPEPEQPAEPDVIRRRASVPLLIGIAAAASILLTMWMHRGNLFDSEEAVPETAVTEQPVAVPEAEPEPAVVSTEELAEDAQPEPGLPDFAETLTRIQQTRQPREPERDVTLQLVRPLEILNAEPEEAEPNAETSEAMAVTNVWLNSYDNAELWQASPDNYVLQVGAFSSERRLHQFLSTLEYEDIAVYHTQRGGQNWYVATLGRFASADDARDFLASANERIRSLQAWPKSIAAVQSELAAVLP